MPPKRNTSITPSAVTPASGKHWESSLSAAVFEEVKYPSDMCICEMNEGKLLSVIVICHKCIICL